MSFSRILLGPNFGDFLILLNCHPGFSQPSIKCSLPPFSILNVSAIVLANLCVSYIMTSQNEEAEELMRKIEKEEEQLAYEDPDRKVFHLCIVNLVIGKRSLKFLPPNEMTSSNFKSRHFILRQGKLRVWNISCNKISRAI